MRSEEEFWKTKSRINWLMEGDANTKFFHTSTLNRRRRNKILALQNEAGEWIDDHKGIEDVTFQFYSSIFTTDHQSSTTGRDITHCVSHTLSPGEHNTLRAHLRISEIRNTLFSFKPFKALGPDGPHPIFYQKYWNVLEGKVTSFCKQVFHTLEMNFVVNTTHLCMVPKCANATVLNNFRPISLCNTMYKLNTKIIVNRIKHVLSSIIGPNLASFLSNMRASNKCHYCARIH